MNKVIKNLILSDLALLTGFGFTTPIFAVFLTDNIKGGTLVVVGFATAIYWVVNSLTMIPFGYYLDKHRGEKDDLWFVIIGNLLGAAALFGFIFSRLPWHVYVLQGIYGLGMAMNIPGYTAIFTRHIDKNKEAIEWSVRSAFIGLGSGVAGALGGVIAYDFGFKALFIGSGIFVILSALLPLLITKEMKARDGKATILDIKVSQPPPPKI